MSSVTLSVSRHALLTKRKSSWLKTILRQKIFSLRCFPEPIGYLVKAHLRLEFIGAANYDMLRQFDRVFPKFGFGNGGDRPDHPFRWPGPCVLRMHRDAEGRVQGDRVWGNRDYSNANSKGTRGVYVNYILEENELYWVKAPMSWKSVSFYYCAVTPSGELKRITDEDAQEWLSAL